MFPVKAGRWNREENGGAAIEGMLTASSLLASFSVAGLQGPCSIIFAD